MVNPSTKGFITHGNYQISGYVPAPIAGTENSQDSATAIFNALLNHFATNGNRIKECIDYALELDGDAYSIYITGSPVELACVEAMFNSPCWRCACTTSTIEINPWL